MNRILVSTLLLSLSFSSCKMLKNGGNSNKNDGQITSKSSSSWTPVRPKGMVPIPGGSFVLGQSDYDFTQNNDAPVKTVSVAGFFMDDTEITNSEYQIFVNYVKDSIARTALAMKAEELGFDPMNPGGSDAGIGAYSYVSGSKDGEGTPYDEYIQQSNTGRDGNTMDGRKLNWNVKLEWDKYKYPDVDYTEVMEGLYFPPEERMNGERRIDTRKLTYQYVVVDQMAAAKQRGTFQVDFRKEFQVNVYPDTTVWVRDFNYSYNDPMHQDYFWHSAYSNYPVVGVNWNQANAFADFRTRYHNNALNKKKKKNGSANKVITYRLPTEIEWEYAARGGIQNAPYPWGGPYLTDDRGCYLANFKPKRGDYIEITKGKKTGFMYTAPVKTFQPNGYGLYDMAGNVAEWTLSPHNRTSYQMASSLNPSITLSNETKMVVRGGSWKDIGYMLMVSTRDMEQKDSARSFIGFRTVQPFPDGSKVTYRKTK
ncbi:T9SS ring complex lipoprotein PorK/GldK [Faecalibacter rhinopitheci]|uniref:Gliding motility lipoprotein GldK n=1 Tax=Faecalibacter rhinopitheci TaxID=2779678 RepID=A0A8J7KCW0_9FLAO|nr:gliding motility lipoprotein GldK [Faecalibacter rhinopitheci]MBF0596671.1 gliding motility lipoprotein GldK [Faecalibacter rhinopitheci]MBQ0147066.1 gliding motility lipoprotein GldK [Candidatus Onthonaster equi]